MDKLQQAYEQLGLAKDASRDEVERRYMLLVKRARAQARSEASDNNNEDRLDFDQINQAYRYIVDEEKRRAVEELDQQTYGKYKKYAGTAAKLDHFLHYYKWHLIGGLAVVLFIAYAINSYVDSQAEKRRLALLPPPAVTVMLHGYYFMDDAGQEYERLEEALLLQFPEWERMIASITFVPDGLQSPQDPALIQKAFLQLITEKRDVYVLDDGSFESLVLQGLLQPLAPEDVAALGPLSESRLMTAVTDDDPQERVYAIDLTGSPLIEELPIFGQRFIAGIRTDAENRENALAFIRHFAATVPE